MDGTAKEFLGGRAVQIRVCCLKISYTLFFNRKMVYEKLVPTRDQILKRLVSEE